MTIRLLHLDGLVVDRERRTLHRGDVCVIFRHMPIRWELALSLLMQGPRSVPQMADAFYPAEPLDIVEHKLRVHICLLNRMLRALGIRIDKPHYKQPYEVRLGTERRKKEPRLLAKCCKNGLNVKAILGAARCPHCGNLSRAARAGVYMTPIRAAIFDAIKRTGMEGAAPDELYARIYPDGGVGRQAVKAHVWQIRQLLVETEWEIVGSNRYYLVPRGRQ